MKVALISYHKNVTTIYKKEWIVEYWQSIENQTYKGFKIFELNYGGGKERIFKKSNYHSKEFPTFVHALNFLLDHLFFIGYDYVFNSNVDDYFNFQRIEAQLPYLKQGYDIVTSNFALIQDGETVKYHQFHELNIAEQLSVNHNIICHPCVAYSKKFWEKNRYVPEQMPLEDMMLWQRAIKNSKFIILPDILLYHRLHDQSVCQSENR